MLSQPQAKVKRLMTVLQMTTALTKVNEKIALHDIQVNIGDVLPGKKRKQFPRHIQKLDSIIEALYLIENHMF
jgi:hypothetical protein